MIELRPRVRVPRVYALWPEDGELVVYAPLYQLSYAPVRESLELMFGVDKFPNTLASGQTPSAEEGRPALLTVEDFQYSMSLW